MPPSAAKKLFVDLSNNIQNYEAENGKIKAFSSKHKKSKTGQPLTNMLKSLYKSRKVSKRMISVNTRRKKPPAGN